MSHISQFVFVFSCSLPTNRVSILDHLLLVSLANVLLVTHLNDVCMLLLLTEVWHMAHFWVSYGRCTMPGSPMGQSEGLSRRWTE